MPKRLQLEHRYPAGADRVFALVSDLDVLEAVSKPWVQFNHLPSGPVRTGQKLDVALSILGIWPARSYGIYVRSCDPDARLLHSEERGMGIRRLTHEVQVLTDRDGCVLVDRLYIDAGWRTPFVTGFAWFMSRWRHRIRLRLLHEG